MDEKENRFTLYGAESDRIAYPVEGQHSYAACVDGKGTGVQADKFNAARTHPVCALTWRFSQGVANLHLRVGVKGWAGGDSAPTGRTAYRIEAFYQDTSISTSTPAVATSFLSEDVDYYKSVSYAPSLSVYARHPLPFPCGLGVGAVSCLPRCRGWIL